MTDTGGTGAADAGASGEAGERVRSGPRHAAPRKQLRSRLQLPAAKVLAFAAVPTALLMGAGYTPTLALAGEPGGSGAPKACATAPDAPADGVTPAKQDRTPAAGRGGRPDRTGRPAPGRTTPGLEPEPAASTSPLAVKSAETPAHVAETGPTTQKPSSGLPGPSSPPPSGKKSQGLVGGFVGGVTHLLSGGKAPSVLPTPSASPSQPASPKLSASPSSSPSSETSGVAVPPEASGSSDSSQPGSSAGGKNGGSTEPAHPAPTRKADHAGKPAKTPKAVGDAAASVLPSRSSSSTASGADARCAADASELDAAAGPDPEVIPDQPWTLKSSKLALHGAVFGGVAEVTTHSGAKKRVLKFTVGSIDIGDLDMSTIEAHGKTFHVKGAKGQNSTLTEGPIVMYTEKLQGHLEEVVGLPVPVDLGEITLTPDTLPKFLYDLVGSVPISLDLTFTDVKAVQAGQFGGTLKIPGMSLYNDDEPYDG